MFKMSGISMVFNLAGVAAALVVGGYAINSMLSEDKAPACGDRYSTATAFSTRTGADAPMTSIELQSRMGADEWGVLDNLSVVKGKAGGGDVLQVRLQQGTASPFQTAAPQGGAGFSWSPETIGDADRACLSYSVMVPKDFEFSTSGMLPGLFGGERIDRSGDTGFVTRLMWRQDGALNLVTQAPTLGRDGRVGDPTRVKLDRGRWVRIESEVVLNTPEKSDGLLRLWIDGDLKVERKSMKWRTDRGTSVKGVLSDVAYGDIESSSQAKAPKDTTVRLTPFELSWD